MDEQILEEKLPIDDFLKMHTAYDLLPESGKVVVIDVGLSISSAFQALAENGITSAPLWDGKRQEYSGMLTVTDMAELLIEFYTFLTKEEFETSLDIVTIREWNRTRRMKPVVKKTEGSGGTVTEEKLQLAPRTPLIFVHPEASLYDTAKALLAHHIHRGPVLDTDTNTVLHVITHARIIRYLVSHWKSDRRLLQRTMSSLGIGVFAKLGNQEETKDNSEESPKGQDDEKPENKEFLSGEEKSSSSENDPKKEENADEASKAKKEQRESQGDEVVCVSSSATVIEVLRLMQRKHLSAVPVVEGVGCEKENEMVPRHLQAKWKKEAEEKEKEKGKENEGVEEKKEEKQKEDEREAEMNATSSNGTRKRGKVVGLYSLSDIRYLPLHRLHSALSMNVMQALRTRRGLNIPPLIDGQPKVHTCHRNDKLVDVLKILAGNNIHRAVVVDDEGCLDGVISVNDILRFFTS
ncbi:putative CBS domain-containing protein [Monocercomonoides exilis]|uniref:putative CBS domain-containing protein n=1 Tax=Monocercomonoides exilis TaxID=2049356 RepID=UPI0035594D1B|nr:putative CBS domain-containing protein [Monocercomonoides exilis]|eukprot:MONOS_4157.1-p1 / transcript=MONOS_4157.1 / gene=MONOS_4157 / organism=Monocercomonoides_exilis_PA203 / gene_product=CBS domain-containing protein / transcript_product=CBS domain-containing protein / location=Mono_scaffold00106:102523-104206(+) / protein_length=464 / sequence_SO=supercontig / SO=protein_coding / is_pseudo=false